jgi:hypothetical protein
MSRNETVTVYAWEEKVLRKVYGPISEQGVQRIRTEGTV